MPNCLIKNEKIMKTKSSFQTFKNCLTKNSNVMKRLISVLVAVMFMTGMVVAQSNESDVEQEGTGHEATVNQNGSSNTSNIVQDQGFNYDLDRGSKAEVDQDGSSNSSDINSWGWNHEVYVTQNGSENASALSQSGGENDAYVDQIGDKNILRGKSEGSAAYQKAGDPFGNDKNYFDVDQTGNENTVGMWQEHSAEAVVNQNGDKNLTEIYQSGPAYGDDNTANVVINGDENMTDVHQFGDGNSATLNVGHANYAPSNYSNEAAIKQTGNSNDASFDLQKGANNNADIDQNGDNNYTELSVKYGNDNEAVVDVDGDANRSRISVSTQWGDMSDGNQINLTQDGYQNYASGDIEGDNNDIDVLQQGDYNRVGTSWYTKDGFDVMGNNNTIDIEQMSNSNKSLNSVVGNSNSINVSQH